MQSDDGIHCPAPPVAQKSPATWAAYRLPYLCQDARGNMLTDLCLLEASPPPQATCCVYFRPYGWVQPCATFGYSQAWSWAHGHVQPQGLPLFRRPTGGGLVYHGDRDWTYSLVLRCPGQPTGSADLQPRALYQHVHCSIQHTLQALGLPTCLYTHAAGPLGPVQGPTACFTAPAPSDVLCQETGQKLAGAAQKRTRHGLLLQGSIRTDAAGRYLPDWHAFQDQWLPRLARAVSAALGAAPLPTCTHSAGAAWLDVPLPPFDALCAQKWQARLEHPAWVQEGA
jgi:lipoate-protein ligase A